MARTARLALGVLAALACCAAGAAGAAGAEAAAGAAPLMLPASIAGRARARGSRAPPTGLRYQKPYNICTSPWDPIVTCDPAADPSTYDGYQIELWRRITQDMGWADSDWQFTCIDWTPMIEDLMDPGGACTMAAAGVEVSLDNLVAGLKMSWPIYKSGFQVMTSGKVVTGGTWTFAEAFHWSVWAVLVATAVALSLIIAVVEYFTLGNKSNRKGLQGWSWYSWAQLMHIHAHVGDPGTWGARVLVLAYGFLIVIMVHLYTATLASRLTQQRLANNIQSKADLPGKPVQTWDSYTGLLRKYSIDAAGLPWESDEDTATFIKNLRNGTYKALVLDAPVIAYLVSTMNDQCDLQAVGESFETFDIAISFPADAPDVMVSAVSRSIVHLQTKHALLDELENRYITNAHGEVVCPALDNSHGSGNIVVHIEQVAGLWYIVGASVLVGLSMVAFSKLRERLRHAAAGGGDGGDGGAEGAGGAFMRRKPRVSSFWGTTLSFNGGRKLSSVPL